MNQLFGCHHLKVRPSSICDRAAKVSCADTSMWDSFPWAYIGRWDRERRYQAIEITDLTAQNSWGQRNASLALPFERTTRQVSKLR